jgi:hypothetical protein
VWDLNVSVVPLSRRTHLCTPRLSPHIPSPAFDNCHPFSSFSFQSDHFLRRPLRDLHLVLAVDAGRAAKCEAVNMAGQIVQIEVSDGGSIPCPWKDEEARVDILLD